MSAPLLASSQANLNAEAVAVSPTASPNYQDILLGTMAAAYLGAADDALRVRAPSQGLIPVAAIVGTGIVTGDASSIETHWDLPIPIFSPQTGFDMRGVQGGFLPNTSGMSDSAWNNAFLQLSWQDSALEGRTLSQFINSPTISTWQGMQMANFLGTPIYEIWNEGAQAKYSPFESGIADANFDWNNMNVGDDQKRAMQNDVAAGHHIFAPLASVRLGTWTGAVWVSATINGSGLYSSLSQLIMGNGDTQAHGSFGTDEPPDALPVFSPRNTVPMEIGDPVEVSNGNMHHEEQDFSIPNVGLPIKFERRYDSLSTADMGMGDGWSYTYGDQLTVDELGNVTWHTSEGVNYKFNYDSTNYTALGLFGKLTHSGGTYQYRERNGVTYTFGDSTLRLTQILDANGQGVDVTATSIGPTSVKDHNDPSRIITFTYDVNNRIASVADWTGRTWLYTYFIIPGFQGTPGRDTTYHLASASLSGATSLLSMSYGYYPLDQAGNLDAFTGLLKTITDNNDGGTHTYEYYTNRKAFRVTDAEGNQESFFYDLFNHVTRHSDMRGISTSFAFKSDGLGLTQTIFNPDGTRQDNEWGGTLLTSSTDEIGRRDTYEYHAGTGNVKSHVAKDGVTTSYEYIDDFNSSQSTFNFVTQTTLPEGRFTDYAYDTNGNLCSETQHNGTELLVTSLTIPGFVNRGLPSNHTDTKDSICSHAGHYSTDITHTQAGQVLTETTHPVTGDIVYKYTYDNRGFKTGQYVMSGTSKNVTSIAGNGMTATATVSSHGYSTGDVVEIHGANEALFNGFFTITVTGSNTFTYTASGTLPSSDTGAIVSESTVSSTTYTDDLVGHLLTSAAPDPDGAGPLTTLMTTNVYKAGNLISVTDPAGNKTSYAYDRIE